MGIHTTPGGTAVVTSARAWIAPRRERMRIFSSGSIPRMAASDGLTSMNAVPCLLASPLTVDIAQRSSLTLEGNVGPPTEDGPGVTKSGTGVLTLSGDNTYTGGTTVDSGALTFLTTGAKPASGTTTVAAGATLGLGVGTGPEYFVASDVDSLFAGTLTNVTNDPNSNVGIDTTAGDFIYTSSISATRGLNKLGPNTLTLTGANRH